MSFANVTHNCYMTFLLSVLLVFQAQRIYKTVFKRRVVNVAYERRTFWQTGYYALQHGKKLFPRAPEHG